MTSLLDVLKNKSAIITPGGASPGTGSTSMVADLLKAKTGRAVDFPGTGSTPKMSTLGEASAVAQNANQLQQVQQQATTQAQQLVTQAATQDTEADLAKKQVEGARLTQMQQRADRAAQLIQDFKTGKQELNLDRNRAQAEQLGQDIRLSTDKYVTQLQQAGEEMRLEDDTQFRRELATDIFAENSKLLAQKLNMAETITMQENKWIELLAGMDLDFALQVAGQQADAANQTAAWSAAGNATSAGVDAYGKQQSGAFDQDYQDSKTDSYGAYKKEHP